jgi:hypothetical protein
VTFFYRDAERPNLHIEPDDMYRIKHHVSYYYLSSIIDELGAQFLDTLLDYYEELTEAAIGAGITSPDNYDETSKTPFQVLMKQLLDKYIARQIEQVSAAMPEWVRVGSTRDQAIVRLTFDAEDRKISDGMPMDWRFVKSSRPQDGGFMFASSNWFTRNQISQTRYERLVEIANRWMAVNPNLSFGIH